MKRIIALFAVFALVFCLTFVPVKAEGTAWSLPFSKIETLLDLAQQLFSGAEVNLAEISNQALGLYEFILDYEYYLNENGVYVPTLSMSQADALRIGLSSLALNGENELTALSDLTIPIKASDIAHFINYRSDWIKRYNPDNSDVVVAIPDANYISYINKINTDIQGGFYWKTFTGTHILDANNYTWCNYKSYSSQDMCKNYSPYDLVRDITISSPCTILIDGSGSSWTFTLTNYDSSPNYWDNQFHVFNTSGTTITERWVGSAGNILWTNNFTQLFSSLDAAMTFTANNFRNINLFVNGELWATTATAPVDPFLQLGAVALGDLGTTTFPVYTLDQEGDLGLDVGAFADWLDGVIKSGATAISLGDVIADGIEIVDTETGERAISDNDAEDVAKVIAGVQATTAPNPSLTPSPSPTPDPYKNIIPPLKIIPPLLDPALRPSDIPRQTTVLSEIIDATNKTVPQDIMILFWSTIGLLVVGGLIYIMHK